MKQKLSFISGRATEILFSLTLAEMRRVSGDGRPVAGFPAREHFQRLTTGRRSLALFQHHDGITGTARDPVVVDYGTRWLLSVGAAAFKHVYVNESWRKGLVVEGEMNMLSG